MGIWYRQGNKWFRLENQQRMLKRKNNKNAWRQIKTDENASGDKFVRIDIPYTTFDDVAGLYDVKEAVMYKAIYPHRYPEICEKYESVLAAVSFYFDSLIREKRL